MPNNFEFVGMGTWGRRGPARVDTAYEIEMANRQAFRRKKIEETIPDIKTAVEELHARGFDARIVVCPQYLMDRLHNRSVFVIPHKAKRPRG